MPRQTYLINSIILTLYEMSCIISHFNMVLSDENCTLLLTMFVCMQLLRYYTLYVY